MSLSGIAVGRPINTALVLEMREAKADLHGCRVHTLPVVRRAACAVRICSYFV